MNFLTRYKVLSGEPGYNKWLSSNDLIVDREYICVGFSKNIGIIPPSIHLINGKGIIVNIVYMDDRFTLVQD